MYLNIIINLIVLKMIAELAFGALNNASPYYISIKLESMDSTW